MDNIAQVSELIDQLDDNLDNLQTALKTIINKSLTDVAADYPVLDRAKLYILVTYAIESAIFSFLRLTGTSAREHPVYRELERVKQYFQKAKLAETSLQRPNMRLDQGAAGRFIKAALAGNDAPKPVSNMMKESVIRHADTASTSSSISRKRKLEIASVDPEDVPKGTQVSESADSDSQSMDDDPQTITAVSSKQAAAVMTPSKRDLEPNLAAAPDLAENETAKALSKKERKKLRKAEKKNLSPDVIMAASESVSVEPRQKKVKTDEDSKKDKKRKRKKQDSKSNG